MNVALGFAPEFDPETSKGWCPVTLTVTEDDAPIPLAPDLHAYGAFDSGFDYSSAGEVATFTAKDDEGNIAAILCAAALAAISGGELRDPQVDLSATGDSAAEIIAQLVEDRKFLASVSGPDAMPTKSKKVAKAGKAKAAKAAKVAKPLKSDVVADMSKPVRPYAASAKFEIGERIEHPSFGEGLIEVSELGKITVIFASGRRVLVQAKDGGNNFGAKGEGLDKATPFDHANPSAGGKPVPRT